ncbi:MAG: hypothetical protein COV46_07175 [Deltaproteobacteria bacterium CG11_big_fil_rev_8_21_14_0_20_49_13]|nr:MAG: hypothetical protein COV46_07175 [Deltaproteobacteria bacterium CG11_big_fil_rev_8_21_14_0_20_49_13]
MAKRQMQELARQLRTHGLSYSEIKSKVPAAKGTISNWCKDIQLSENQVMMLGRTQKEQTL